MKFDELKKFTKICVENQRNLLIVGRPGCGKTHIVREIARELDYELVVFVGSSLESVDIAKYPIPDLQSELVKLFPNELMNKIINPKKHTICFFDDLGLSSLEVQKAFMQVLHGGDFNDTQISEKVSFVAATNGLEDNAGIDGFLSPLKSRFHFIINLEYDYKSYSQYLLSKGYDSELIAFIEFKKNTILDSFITSTDLNINPCERIYEEGLCKSYKFIKEDKNFYELCCSCIGTTLGSEFAAFRDKLINLPDFDDVMNFPEKYTDLFNEEPTYANLLVNVCLSKLDKSKLDKYAIALKIACGEDFFLLFFTKFANLVEQYVETKELKLQRYYDAVESEKSVYVNEFINKYSDLFI